MTLNKGSNMETEIEQLRQKINKFGKIKIANLPNGKWKVGVSNGIYTVNNFPDLSLKRSLESLVLRLERDAEILNCFSTLPKEL
jgi:hypothetical protein